jgi:probable F420-dependent oxidoreductase
MSLSIGITAPYSDATITSGPLMRDFVGLLEELGVESLWTVEHVIEAEQYERLYPYSESGKMPGRFVPMADPLEILAFAAAVSTTLKLGTGVMVAPLHSPVILAKRVATLDRLSGGRVLLGLGIGWQKEEYTSVGVPYADRGARLDETIEAMRELWASRPATYHGRFVGFEQVHLLPPPTSGAVPIIIGGSSDPAVRRCGRVGNGWFPHAMPAEAFARGAELLAATASQAGRSIDDIPITVSPGSVDRAQEMDPDFVRPYVEHGATRLIINAAITDPGELGLLRERIVRYQNEVIGPLQAIAR